MATPEQRKLWTADDVKELKKQGVEFVRLGWTDNSNISRCRLFTIDRFAAVQASGTGLTPGSFAGFTPLFDASAPGSGITATGDIHLVPDVSSAKILPHRPNNVLVMADGFNRETETPDDWCARSFLKKQVARLRKDYNMDLVAGVELEFVLLDAATKAPADSTVYAEFASLRGKTGRTFERIIRTMTSVGLEPWISHSESANGQFEVVLQHTTALESADQVCLVRDLIKDIADQEGLRATFAPKVTEGQAGSGCHVHLSLVDLATGKNLFPEQPGVAQKLSETARHFMAGILKHLPALTLITLPSYMSYARILPHYWAGAYACWGYENKEAALRLPGYGEPNNVEVKCVDHTANMYLALGALLAAGLDGLDNTLELMENVQEDPADKPRADILPLPNTLAKAIKQFEDSEFCRKTVGDRAFSTFLAVRKYENELLGTMTAEDRRNLYIERY